ncbi:hypothetical protein G9A89_000531 [Geosiphon pyriformis]|nr:hypothetical protein G9A89_000531 [Geosiphon pyriformis]
MCNTTGTPMSRTHEPYDPGIPQLEYDRTTSIYGELGVSVPRNVSSPKGKTFTLMSSADANQYYDWSFCDGNSAFHKCDSY